MSDLDDLKALLDRWEVPGQIELTVDGSVVVVGDTDGGKSTAPTINGYTGFYTTFEFTTAGKFIRMGAWE